MQCYVGVGVAVHGRTAFGLVCSLPLCSTCSVLRSCWITSAHCYPVLFLCICFGILNLRRKERLMSFVIFWQQDYTECNRLVQFGIEY